jgi:hypothetical protein
VVDKVDAAMARAGFKRVEELPDEWRAEYRVAGESFTSTGWRQLPVKSEAEARAWIKQWLGDQTPHGDSRPAGLIVEVRLVKLHPTIVEAWSAE